MAGPATKGSKIVVAVNDSDESMHSLSWCLQNFIPSRKARNSDITLVLLYVKPAPPPPDHTGLFWSKIGAMLEEYGKETALTVMEKAKEMCKSCADLDNVKIESIVASGDARDVICETVDKLGADILIMGGHPLTATQSNSESVSEHCAQKVKCPVLIVKQPGHGHGHCRNHQAHRS
ncbi:hypothetical protein EJ110_NYTH40690 [Nymphaea thermarum]|nr:hypothetical protein EJ110_NYTH40690 [Nymphaea thermarum]